MDLEVRAGTAPFREPGYAPRRLEVEHRAGGELVLTNPTPFARRFQIITDPLDHWAAEAPGRTWLAERSGAGWRTVSFLEARERVAALAAGLGSLGVLGPRPLLILSANAVDDALMTYAAAGQGMPAAPISAQYGLKGANLARLGHACDVLKPAAVYVEDAALFANGLASPSLAGLPVIAGRSPRPGDIPLDALYRHGAAAPCARSADHAKYLLTSGSTGPPKAVVFLHQGMSVNAAQIEACFADREPPVMVNCAPWSHSLGGNAILHMSLHRGGTLYIDGGAPVADRFGETLRNLKELSPTFHSMVPAAWMLLAEALDRDEDLARRFFARLKVMQYGGASLGQAVGDRIQAAAVRTVGQRITFASGYGATETGPTACNVHWPNARMGLVGLPLPGASVRLVPQGGKLEFRVKGPQVSPGYLGRPDLTAQAFDEEGYYRLGDAARLAEPDDPAQGLVFDGRLSENFKLANGTFVSCGELRIAAVSAVGAVVTDAVVCGESQDGVGLLFYPAPEAPRAAVEAAVRDGVEALNATAGGVTQRVARALVLPGPPDPHQGEITEKGYIAQTVARRIRAPTIAELFADPPGAQVLVFA